MFGKNLNTFQLALFCVVLLQKKPQNTKKNIYICGCKVAKCGKVEVEGETGSTWTSWSESVFTSCGQSLSSTVTNTKCSTHSKHIQTELCSVNKKSTFINAAAALRLITATDSRLRRRGNRFRAERKLEKEQSEAVPGVAGVCGTLKPSVSSTMRKVRPRNRGSTI